MKRDTLLTALEIRQIYKLSRATFERWVSLGLIPEPTERVQRNQGGQATRYWTSSQIAELAPLFRDYAAGTATRELALRYGPETNRR